MTKCEDDNDPFDIYFMTYDYNYHLHDNVTCDMSFIPYEPNLFTLEHDGNYDYNCEYFILPFSVKHLHLTDT